MPRSTNKNKPGWLRLWPYARPYSGWILIACVAGALRFAVPLALPWAVKVLVDDVLPAPDSARRTALFFQIMAGLTAAYVSWIFVSYLRLYFTGLAGSRMVFDLRGALHRHIQKMPLAFLERWKTGSIVSRLLQDMASVQQLVTQGATSAFMDLVSILLVGALMAGMNWQLALVSFAAVPLYVFWGKTFMDRVRRTSREVQEQAEKLSGNLHEKISGMPVVRAFAKEKREEEIFSTHARGHLAAILRSVKLQSWGLSLMGFLAALTPLCVIGFGAWLVLRQKLTVGQLMAFYAYAGFLYMPLNRLMELNVVIGGALAAADRIFEIFDLPSEISEKSFEVQPAKTRGRISFEGVSFSYSGKEPVFERLDLQIASHERVALTGPSGCGKSTLIKLLLRFYEARSGIIYLDGRDVRQWDPESLREQIAWVPQEPYLFSGSILENILYGRTGAGAGEAVEAARAACAHEFIMALPDKYETQVGEKGQALSAGEKQRLAIARALLKNAPVWVLDEPSSALDERSERLVHESLKQVLRGKTALIISHRLSMMDGADRAVYFCKGKIQPFKSAAGDPVRGFF